MSSCHLMAEEVNHYESDDFIPLSVEDKRRLYKHWEKSLIIKLFEKKIGYRFLLHKLQSLWNLSEELVLMDLGNEFYLIRLKKIKIMSRSFKAVLIYWERFLNYSFFFFFC